MKFLVCISVYMKYFATEFNFLAIKLSEEFSGLKINLAVIIFLIFYCEYKADTFEVLVFR